MSLKSQLRVGQTINLLNGIYPSFDDPFKSSSGNGKETFQLPQEVLTPKDVLYNYTICLTDNWNVLYSHIVDIYFSEKVDVSPVTAGYSENYIYIDEEEAIDSITSFSLYRQDKLDTIKLNLANFVGINQEHTSLNSNVGYLLVKISRINYVWTQSSLSDFLRKSTSNIISPTTKDLIDFFYKSGTHYIFEITFGNCVYQIFVYEKEKYQEVKFEIQKQKSNMDFMDFYGYARINSNNTGYTKYAGELKLAGQDPLSNDFKERIKDEMINDQGQPSIFSLIYKSELLESIFINTTSIGLKLTSLIGYSDPNPLHSEWSITLGSSLLQKFGQSNRFLKFYDNQSDNIYKDFISPFVPIITTPILTVSQVFINLDTFHKDYDLIYKKPTKLILLVDIIHISTEVELPDEIVIVARMIFVTSPKSKIIISSNIYENCKIFIDQVSPAIVIKQKNSNERMTIFGKTATALIIKQPDPNNPNNEIPSSIDIKYVFNDEYLRNTFFSQISPRIIDGIGFLLTSMESISHARLNDDNELKIAAKKFIIWIYKFTSILQNERDEDSIKSLNQRASTLYYNGFPSPTTPLSVPFLRYRQYSDAIKSYLDSIKVYQNEAKQTINEYNEKIKEIHETETQNISLGHIKKICIFLKNRANLELKKEERAFEIYSENHLQIDQALTTTENQIHDLENKLADGKKDMDFLFKKLLKGLDEWKMQREEEERSKIIANIVAIGIAIDKMFTANVEEDTISVIREIADKVNKIVTSIQEVNKLVKFLNEAKNKLVVPTPSYTLSSIMALDWEEWIINVKNILEKLIPKDETLTQLKNDYYSSVGIMKSRGIAYIGA
ncbi:3937_t:CDS:2, partial [Cetraspora pellucida]